MDQSNRISIVFVGLFLALAGCTAHGDVDQTGSLWSEPEGKLSPAQALKATRDGQQDVERGKKHYRDRNFGLAEQHYRRATERAPQDVEAWVGLAATYDLILSKRERAGHWKMTYSYQGKTWADAEERGKPSKWVNLRALRVLKGGGIEA